MSTHRCASQTHSPVTMFYARGHFAPFFLRLFCFSPLVFRPLAATSSSFFLISILVLSSSTATFISFYSLRMKSVVNTHTCRFLPLFFLLHFSWIFGLREYLCLFYCDLAPLPVRYKCMDIFDFIPSRAECESSMGPFVVSCFLSSSCCLSAFACSVARLRFSFGLAPSTSLPRSLNPANIIALHS